MGIKPRSLGKKQHTKPDLLYFGAGTDLYCLAAGVSLDAAGSGPGQRSALINDRRCHIRDP